MREAEGKTLIPINFSPVWRDADGKVWLFVRAQNRLLVHSNGSDSEVDYIAVVQLIDLSRKTAGGRKSAGAANLPAEAGEETMFSVIFEVHPRPEQWDAYLGNAKMLRPEMEQVDGFVDNIHLTCEGWIVSVSGWRDEKSVVRWRDEKSVVRWRTKFRHHQTQEKGRAEILLDYHLRVGQLTRDTRLPEGNALREQRLDETEVGEDTTVTLIDTKRPPEWVKKTKPDAVAEWLGFAPDAAGPSPGTCSMPF